MSSSKVIRRVKRMGFIFIGILFICLTILFIILPYSKGILKPYLNDSGQVIENSISEKVFIEVNGENHGMFIKGIDKTKPVLLLLHGGPGMTDYFLAQDYPTNLESEFVVVYWEQLGTGLSFNKNISVDDMTTERFISDAIEVTNYLRDEFNKEKIYLLGHSFGSYLGIKTIEEAPELYHAYIAMSQITNQLESEKMAYSYMIEEYSSLGNQKMVKKLETFSIFDSDVDFNEYLNSGLRDKTMHELGVGTMRNMNSVIKGIFLPSLRCTDYTQSERIDLWKGKVFSRNTNLMSEVYDFNASSEIQEIQVPIYFFAGLHDYTVAYELQKDYYDLLSAPIKGFYTFDNSAHSPIFEEPDFALEIIKTDVLNADISLSDN